MVATISAVFWSAISCIAYFGFSPWHRPRTSRISRGKWQVWMHNRLFKA
jgi:hypothetical protein